jgi:uncharacterized protein YndB with AHSA1/START domain
VHVTTERPSTSASRGVLLIADISGYTVYLKDSELEHAQAVLSDLLSVLVKSTHAPLVISRLEGDAVFSYALGPGMVQGQTLVEMIEGAYVGFRRAIEQMVRNTSCRCNACANISGLDLKFFVHHGAFMIQAVGKYRELVGLDVNVAHRLTKNSVVATTGIAAYALYSAAAVEALGLEEAARDWRPHREAYDAGEVECFVADMRPVWDAARDRPSMQIPESDVRGKAEVEIALSPELVWDRLTDPDHRRILIGSDRQELSRKAKRRLGEGDVYRCFHGDVEVPSEVLEWLPFRRLLTRDLIHVPGGAVHLLVDYGLEPVDRGTRLSMTAARPTGSALAVAAFAVLGPRLMDAVARALVVFKERVEA